MAQRVYSSPPHMSGREQHYVQEAFDSNRIAILAPQVGSFESKSCHVVGAPHARALVSGTAGLHPDLERVVGVIRRVTRP